MTVSKEDINQVTKLARLALSDEELNKYTSELDKILEYIQRLNTVDTTSVEPLTQTFENNESTPIRLDEIKKSGFLQEFREEFLKIAPQTEGRFFKVPKISE